MLATLTRLAGIVAAILAACGGSPDGRLPEIPTILVSAFPDPAREQASARIDAVARNPRDPWANGDLAAILHAYGRPQDATILYERASVLSNGEFRWWYLLGVAQQDSGEHAKAAASFRNALAKRAYAPAAIRLGESLAATGRLEDAAASLRDAVKLDGSGAAASYALGRVLLDRGESQKAIAELERSVGLAPDSGAARYALGMAYRAAGDEVKATRLLGAARGGGNERPPLEDPVLARVQELGADEHYFLNLGQRLEAKGRPTEAIRAYERALALDPAMALAHANLVGVHGQAGDLEQAKKHYDLALSRNPEIEELHNNWGVLQAMQGDPSEAAASFRRAVEVNPNSARALTNLGMALLALGDGQGAVRRFEQAVANDPTNGPARMNLGTTALEAGRVSEAIGHLEAALDGPGGGGEAFIRYTLGRAYQLAGRQADAGKQMEHAIRIAEATGAEDLTDRIRVSLETLAGRECLAGWSRRSQKVSLQDTSSISYLWSRPEPPSEQAVPGLTDGAHRHWTRRNLFLGHSCPS